MKSFKMLSFLILASAIMLSGCVVRTYQSTRDRVDQDLTAGNRGYLKGHPAADATLPRKTTRTTQVTEIELYPIVKFDKGPKKAKQAVAEEAIFSPSDTTEYDTAGVATAAIEFEKYTVQKNDTLQKISQKFYGTSKKWNKIFQANTATLKSPDKIYPGKVINIPLEGLSEPKENLK